MTPVHLFTLASQHAHWASVRQAVITGNIANANTPNYAALEIEPFSAVLKDTAATMASTAPGHFDTAGAQDAKGARNWDVGSTGEQVALDQELVKAGEVSRSYALDTSIIRSFHNMLLAAARPGS